MTTESDPENIPGVFRASDLNRPEPKPDQPDERQSEARAKRFRRNFVLLLQSSELSLKEVAKQSGVSLQTLRYWKREGISYSRDERLEKVTQLLGISDPHELFEKVLERKPVSIRSPVRSTEVDRSTNPEVAKVAKSQPELFHHFSEEDWDELYSLHGTGGALSPEGVQRAAQFINRKRELRRKFDLLLESHHFESLAHIVEVMFRDSSV